MVDLREYKLLTDQIRQEALNKGISNAQINIVFNKVFSNFKHRRKKPRSNLFFSLKCLFFTLSFIVLCLLSFDHRGFTVAMVRNLQSAIYPGLKILRRIAVPILSLYPQLSEYYDEWCLVENPYFHVSDMDCWPCSVVRSVPDLTGRNVSRSFNFGIPYTRSEKSSRVKMKHLRKLVLENLETFEKNAAKVSSNNASYRYIKDVMLSKMDENPSVEESNHFVWRINRMEPGRVIRKLFPKAEDTPDWWEQSIEKYVIIDEAKSQQYSLPNPECSYVMVRCAEGSRMIKMIPAAECSHACESSTILLSSGNTLWYNWWYWRPLSLPFSNSTGLSIHYITSFC